MTDTIELAPVQPNIYSSDKDKNKNISIDESKNPAENAETTIEAGLDAEATGAAADHNAEPASPTRSKLRMFAIISALYLSLFIAALDTTIVATTVPTIVRDLDSGSGYTWIAGAYLLGQASAGPLYGKLSDIWGRKPILLLAVALFSGGSIICALSSNIAMLIVGRAVQGEAAGGLIQLVHITISDLFSIRQRSLYYGMLEFMWAAAAGIGPTVGGALAERASWRYIFWINLPICGIAFILLLLFLNVHNPRTKMIDGVKAIDWVGSLSILGFVLMLLLGLQFGGETYPWVSPKVICLIVFGALMSLIFIYAEKRFAKFPLIPLRLFQNRSNIATMATTFMHGFAFIAGEFYLPLYFQSVKEASPLHSGLLLLPVVLAEAVLGLFSGVLMHRTGRYRELMWCGMLLLTIGTGLYIMLGPTTSTAKVIGFQLIAGAGAGMVFEPPIIAVQAYVEHHDCAAATSTLGFVRTMSMSISIVIGGVIFQNSMELKKPSLIASGLPQSIVSKLSGGEAGANVMVIQHIDDAAQKLAAKEAFSFGLRNMWILYTVVAFFGFIAAAFIGKKTLSKEHTETVTGLEKMREVRGANG